MATIVDIAVQNAARHGRAPEEEDFLTACVTHRHLLSSEERRYLQQDLESIECAVATDEEYDQEEDGDYYQKCDRCGSTRKCYCYEGESEKVEAVEMLPIILVTAGCPNLNWFGESYVRADKVEETKKAFEVTHAEKCGCSELSVSTD